MAAQPLTIRFSGICTHFRDVVPDVPHRVVLPDAAPLRFGALHLEWSGHDTPYYLIPHFPFLQTPKNVDRLEVPGVMAAGYLQAGARIEIANAIDKSLTYLTFDATPSITAFVTDYAYSEDVVIGGRAACYFDIHGGKVRTERLDTGATRVAIDMETDGPPVLSVTPFDTKIQPTKLTIDTDTLLVANLEVDRDDDDRGFDFLLHYLTARTGLPSRLLHPTPGMSLTPPAFGNAAARTLQALTSIVAAGRPSDEQLKGTRPTALGPSCADSRYP